MLLFLAAGASEAKTITVANGHDHGPGSLRVAIANAASGDTIQFAPGVTTVTLTTAPLMMSVKDLTIKGPGAKKLAIRRSAEAGTPPFPIFRIQDRKVTLSGMTIANGRGGSGNGGGISVGYATLTLSQCAISGNEASTGGGIASSSSDLTITGCTISDNAAVGGTNGGGLYTSGGKVTITRSTICRNSASYGAGIMNYAVMTLTNSTVASNSTSASGAIYNSPGTAQSPIVVRAKNTIIAKNTSGNGKPDFVGTLTSMGYNLIGNTAGATFTGDTTGNRTNVDARLGPLEDNGGPTLTKALLLNSPAIDAGNSGIATIDQRRMPRPVDDPGRLNASGGDGSDIGAVEMQQNELDSVAARADAVEDDLPAAATTE